MARVPSSGSRRSISLNCRCDDLASSKKYPTASAADEPAPLTPARHQPRATRIDLRRSMRRNITRGGEPVVLAYKGKKPRKTSW